MRTWSLNSALRQDSAAAGCQVLPLLRTVQPELLQPQMGLLTTHVVTSSSSSKTP